MKFTSGGAVQGDDLVIHAEVAEAEEHPARRAHLKLSVENLTTGGNIVVAGTATTRL